jgi:hypothetical protein
MFSSVKVNITTDASGNATVYLSPGNNINPNGLLVCLIYTPGTIATGADLTITTENRGIPIMVKANAGTSPVVYNPRAFPNAVADGAAGTVATELIPVKDERIKVVVAEGGNGGVGSIEAILLVNSPY